MKHYLALSFATAVILSLTFLMWRRTKNVAFVLGVAFMYYWSLYGSWAIIKANGDTKEYLYLYYKLFPISLDDDYFWAIVLYALFIIVAQLTVLYFVNPPPGGRPELPLRRIQISHVKIIVMASVLAFLGYLIIKDTITAGEDLNMSAHNAQRESPFFTIFELMFHAAMSLVAIGLAVLFSGKRAKYMVGETRPIMVVGYVFALAGMTILCIRLGNRGQLAEGAILMGLFYFANAVKPSKLLYGGIGALAVGAISLAKLVRDNAFAYAENRSLWGSVGTAWSEIASSTEALSAHFSMYGILHKGLPFTYGTSIPNLLLSVVPRSLWPDRPGTIYDYYVAGVGAIEGQGYTIHHAAAWYLNFGVPGVIIGAVIFGWIWSTLFNRFVDARARRSHLNQVFTVVAFFTFTSAIPGLLRIGPEGYKTTVIEAFLIPVSLMIIVSTKFIKQSGRPLLVFTSQSLR